MTRKAAMLAGSSAVLGGSLWILLMIGHTLTHGSTQTPRDAAILGWESLDFWKLLAIPPALWIVALVAMHAGRHGPPSRMAQAGLVVALLGLGMLSVGVVLETWVLDSDDDFSSPVVQSGWLLYLFGLLPVLPAGMFLLAAGSSILGRRLRILAVVTGVAAPLQWLEMFLSQLSTGSAAWDAAYVLLRGLLGAAWILFGLALMATGPADEPERKTMAQRIA